MISDMEFIVKPAYAIEREFDDNCAYVIVSSSDKYDTLAESANVLVLHFADTEDEKKSDAVTEYDVKAIIDFLDHSSSSYACISCDEGISRSPAIAAGLLKCTGRDDSYIWESYKEYCPNVLVYRTVLRFFYPGSRVENELRNIERRSPEEYRYFRRNGRDQGYDKIIYREVCGYQICYGFIYGEKRNAVLFVKVGRDGTVFGYHNKYLNMASYIAEKHGITVVVSSNPFCSYKWKDPLDDAVRMLCEYFEEQQIDRIKRKVLYYGHSDGASMTAAYGKDYGIFDAFLLSNLPLPAIGEEDDDRDAYSEAIKIMLNMTGINDSKRLILVYGENDTGCKTYEHIMASLSADYGQTFEVHVIKNEEHSISEPVVKILPELFFDENVLIDKGLERYAE